MNNSVLLKKNMSAFSRNIATTFLPWRCNFKLKPVIN